LKLSLVKGRRLCTNTPTRLRSLYNQFLVNVPERKRQENVNVFTSWLSIRVSHIRGMEKRHSPLTETVKGKSCMERERMVVKKRAMGKMGGAKELKFKGQREIQDSIT